MDDQNLTKKLKKSSAQCIATRPMHPRYRLKRKLKKKKRQATIYKTGTNASERQVRKNSKKRKDLLEFRKKVAVHPRARLIKKIIKRQDQLEFVEKFCNIRENT